MSVIILGNYVHVESSYNVSQLLFCCLFILLLLKEAKRKGAIIAASV